MILRARTISATAVVLLTACLGFAVTSAAKKPTTHTGSKAVKASQHGKKSRKSRPRGQQAIDGERTRQIQEALVREHYMTSHASGKWDDATQEALRKYQADQGWQHKTVPDSRALIRLGLGPDHVHLLNPESAMTMPSESPLSNRTRAVARSASPSPAAPASPATSQSSTTIATPVDVSPSR